MLTKNTEIIELNNYEEKEQVTADVKQLKSKLKLEPQQIIKKNDGRKNFHGTNTGLH